MWIIPNFFLNPSLTPEGYSNKKLPTVGLVALLPLNCQPYVSPVQVPTPIAESAVPSAVFQPTTVQPLVQAGHSPT